MNDSHHQIGATADDIQHAIQRLIDADPAGNQGGFVIFVGYRGLDYVQFAMEPNGLLLNWPTMQAEGPERLPNFCEQLELRGYQQALVRDDGPPIPEQIDSMPMGQFMILDDGLYAQTGKDASQNRDLTIELLRDIFGVTDLSRVEIILEFNG